MMDDYLALLIKTQGIVRFEDEFTAEGCKTLSPEESAYAGNGGALWNGPGGKVVFKGPASMIGCGELPVSGYRRGGALFLTGLYMCICRIRASTFVLYVLLFFEVFILKVLVCFMLYSVCFTANDDYSVVGSARCNIILRIPGTRYVFVRGVTTKLYFVRSMIFVDCVKKCRMR